MKGDLEPVSLQFPNIERRSIIRERNITMTSRNSSRSVSCRRKLVRVIEETDERKEREASPEKRITKGVSVNEPKMADDSRKGQNIRVYSIIKTNMVAHVRMYTRKNL